MLSPTKGLPRQLSEWFCLPLLLAVAWIAFCGEVAQAGTPQPKLLLHLKAMTTKNNCQWGSLTDCSQAVTAGRVATATGPFYFAYLLADRASLSGLRAVQVGISYDGDVAGPPMNGQGVDIFNWTLCGDFDSQSTGWPGSGGGIVITWPGANRCQTMAVPLAGYFYLAAYGSDQLKLIPRPLDGLANVADCQSAVQNIVGTDLGSISFSPNAATQGCNPCLGSCGQPTPTKASGWSEIKLLYSH